MADPSYTPTFHHVDWVDNVDRIQAGGTNGFNVRFDAITSDLQQLSTVVLQIDATLDQAASGGGVVGSQQVLTVPVDLKSTPTSTPPPASGGWTYDQNGEAHPAAGPGGGKAAMGLTLPDHIRLSSFRAIGRFEGAAARLTLTLGRAPLNNSAPNTLAEIRSDTQSLTNPYDVTMPIDSTLGLVDLSSFRYFLAATATQISSSQLTSLAAVQLGFLGV